MPPPEHALPSSVGLCDAFDEDDLFFLNMAFCTMLCELNGRCIGIANGVHECCLFERVDCFMTACVS